MATFSARLNDLLTSGSRRSRSPMTSAPDFLAIPVFLFVPFQHREATDVSNTFASPTLTTRG